MARFPFLPQTLEYVGKCGFSINDVGRPELQPVVDRAVKRIEESMRTGLVTEDLSDLDIEITSFPVAVAILSMLTFNSTIDRLKRLLV